MGNMCNGESSQSYSQKTNTHSFSSIHQERKFQAGPGLVNSNPNDQFGKNTYPKRASKLFKLNTNVLITIRDVFPRLKLDYPEFARMLNYPYKVPMACQTLNIRAEKCPFIYLNPNMTYQGALSVPFENYEQKKTQEIPLPFGEGIIIYSDGSTYSG